MLVEILALLVVLAIFWFFVSSLVKTDRKLTEFRLAESALAQEKYSLEIKKLKQE